MKPGKVILVDCLHYAFCFCDVIKFKYIHTRSCSQPTPDQRKRSGANATVGDIVSAFSLAGCTTPHFIGRPFWLLLLYWDGGGWRFVSSPGLVSVRVRRAAGHCTSRWSKGTKAALVFAPVAPPR